MTGSKPHKIYCEALNKWGAEAQTLMVFEEMSELQKELCKHARGKDNREAIAEEIADVQIMLEQMMILHDCEDLVEVTVTPSAAVAVGTNINKQAQETIAATMEEATVLVFIEPSPSTVRINSYRMEEIKHPGAIGIYRRVGTGQFGLIRGRNT